VINSNSYSDLKYPHSKIRPYKTKFMNLLKLLLLDSYDSDEPSIYNNKSHASIQISCTEIQRIPFAIISLSSDQKVKSSTGKHRSFKEGPRSIRCWLPYSSTVQILRINIRDKLTVPHICTPFCISTEKVIDHIDHILEHQQTIRLRTIIEVLISKFLSLNTWETRS
jgi:hypothetical protein